MYLSKVTLKKGKASAAWAQHDFYSAHQLLWQLFTQESERSFLFRQVLGHHDTVFYVLSVTPPLMDHPVLDVHCKPFSPLVERGTSLAFALRANPTSKKNGGNHGVMRNAVLDAKKEGIDCEVKQEQRAYEAAKHWLITRSKDWGVSFDDGLTVCANHDQQAVKGKGKEKKGSIQLSSVDYEGRLTVTDPELFLSSLQKGFGRSKAFGCGLMLIR